MAEWRRYSTSIADEEQARGPRIVGDCYGTSIIARMVEGKTAETERDLLTCNALARELGTELAQIEPQLLRKALAASDGVVARRLR